jgi:CubicO group peptidase (beta-lactamase class C family)
MARLGQLVVEDGGGVVPAAFVHDLRTGGDPALWAAGEYAAFLPGGANRSCWYQPRTEPGVGVAIGIHGQLVYADPARGVVVAKQSSWPTAGDDDADALAIVAARTLAAALA